MIDLTSSPRTQTGYLLWELVITLLVIGGLVAAVYPNLRHLEPLAAPATDPDRLAEMQLQLRLAQQRRVQLLLLQY
ncbi:hypothetical protein IDSA_01875 [Pseudidiomarina salinarum]|uniref:Uncharacterized protein n=1 Tax=Pseudidiomarina salinarum TaxID=435908 RepID=A0A094L9I6_9GAMM|nr:hypothetical protein [Pseudidiomarina salinarum]KFZ31488.1 hypothetical protein IDSA_01875 [Pseudidiomarina salinarum]RUO70750.1 hypothetical protein CWI79_04695 [Pseudidiomarina salinarum]